MELLVQNAPSVAWSRSGLVPGRLGPGPGLVPGPGPWSLVLVPWSLDRGPWSWSHGPWSWSGPGPGLVPGPAWSLVPVPWSLVPGPWSWSLVHGPWSLAHGPWSLFHDTGGPSKARVFHQSAQYQSYGSIRTTIRRRISIRIILDRSRVKLKPPQHQKLKKSLKVFHQKS